MITWEFFIVFVVVVATNLIRKLSLLDFELFPFLKTHLLCMSIIENINNCVMILFLCIIM